MASMMRKSCIPMLCLVLLVGLGRAAAGDGMSEEMADASAIEAFSQAYSDVSTGHSDSQGSVGSTSSQALQASILLGDPMPLHPGGTEMQDGGFPAPVATFVASSTKKYLVDDEMAKACQGASAVLQSDSVMPNPSGAVLGAEFFVKFARVFEACGSAFHSNGSVFGKCAYIVDSLVLRHQDCPSILADLSSHGGMHAGVRPMEPLDSGVALSSPQRPAPKNARAADATMCAATRATLNEGTSEPVTSLSKAYKACGASLPGAGGHDVRKCSLFIEGLAVENQDCQSIIDAMHPGEAQKAQTAALPTAIPSLRSNVSVAHLMEVCTSTVHDALIGVHSAIDAMRLSSKVAPICEGHARNTLKVAQNSSLRRWCLELDGRLVGALETGYFYALHAKEASAAFHEQNPYHGETRRQFCERVISTDGSIAQNKDSPMSQKPEKAAATATSPATAPARPTAPEMPKPQILPTRMTSPEVTGRSDGDAFRIVQVLSNHAEFAEVCTGLVTSLKSEESSVTEQSVLGDGEVPVSGGVLTFNLADQAQVTTCAARMKAAAIQTGVQLGATKPAAAAFMQGSSEQLVEIVDGPWAQMVCNDLATGFITARIAHPNTQARDFCATYAKSVAQMRDSQTIPPIQKAAPLVESKLVLKSVEGSKPSSTSKSAPTAAPIAAKSVPKASVANGADLWSQFRDTSHPKASTLKVVTSKAFRSVAPKTSSVNVTAKAPPAAQAAPKKRIALLPEAVVMAHAAKDSAAPARGDDDDGAKFWRDMFDE